MKYDWFWMQTSSSSKTDMNKEISVLLQLPWKMSDEWNTSMKNGVALFENKTKFRWKVEIL